MLTLTRPQVFIVGMLLLAGLYVANRISYINSLVKVTGIVEDLYTEYKFTDNTTKHTYVVKYIVPETQELRSALISTNIASGQYIDLVYYPDGNYHAKANNFYNTWGYALPFTILPVAALIIFCYGYLEPETRIRFTPWQLPGFVRKWWG